MKVKTSELIGAALDWAVCVAQGNPGDYSPVVSFDGIGNEYPATTYSESWELAGPIIEASGITIVRVDDDWGRDDKGFCNNQRIPVWCAVVEQHGLEESTEHAQHQPMYQVYGDAVTYGSTALVAAMRAFVVSKLGREVDVLEKFA